MKKIIWPLICLVLGALIVLAVVYWPQISNWFVSVWETIKNFFVSLFSKETVETTEAIAKII